jgi:hypothetical protein
MRTGGPASSFAVYEFSKVGSSHRGAAGRRVLRGVLCGEDGGSRYPDACTAGVAHRPGRGNTAARSTARLPVLGGPRGCLLQGGTAACGGSRPCGGGTLSRDPAGADAPIDTHGAAAGTCFLPGRKPDLLDAKACADRGRRGGADRRGREDPRAVWESHFGCGAAAGGGFDAGRSGGSGRPAGLAYSAAGCVSGAGGDRARSG